MLGSLPAINFCGRISKEKHEAGSEEASEITRRSSGPLSVAASGPEPTGSSESKIQTAPGQKGEKGMQGMGSHQQSTVPPAWRPDTRPSRALQRAARSDTVKAQEENQFELASIPSQDGVRHSRASRKRAPTVSSSTSSCSQVPDEFKVNIIKKAWV